MLISAKAILRSNILFRALPEPAIDSVAALATRRAYATGSTIFSQGDAGDALYGVIAGQVRISTSAPTGKEVFLNIMEAGDSFGEIAVIDGQPRTATATTTADSHLMLIHRRPFISLLKQNPEISVHLLNMMCQRLRWTSELVEESAFLDVPSRLARRVLRLVVGNSASDCRRTLRLSQSDLAQFTGVSRQIVNQHLQNWRSRGWIELGRGRITICDRAALSVVAQGESDGKIAADLTRDD